MGKQETAEYRIRLRLKDKAQLQQATRGAVAARIANRARVLLMAHEGKSVAEIAAILQLGSATIKRVKARFRKRGVDSIHDAKKSGRPPKLSIRAQREVIALACSEAPEGRARWTIRLLAPKSGASAATIQRILHRDGQKPWREKNVVRGEDRRGVQAADARDLGPVRTGSRRQTAGRVLRRKAR